MNTGRNLGLKVGRVGRMSRSGRKALEWGSSSRIVPSRLLFVSTASSLDTLSGARCGRGLVQLLDFGLSAE